MLILERTDLEEEEQQAATAAAIANAEEAGKAAKPTGLHSEVPKQDAQVGKSTPAKEDGDLASANLQGSKDSDKERSKVGGTLLTELYQYYYGSSADMGTLIEQIQPEFKTVDPLKMRCKGTLEQGFTLPSLP
eukprot:c25091_g1_i6 orf=3-398(-)